jgi:hypothetical protein
MAHDLANISDLPYADGDCMIVGKHIDDGMVASQL